MRKAVRAIIFSGDKLLVMHRNKYGSQYFTLVGGQISDNETPQQALVREVKEETGMKVVAASLVYIEEHALPYNEQMIYLCEVENSDSVTVQADSEEATMNKYGMNIHTPQWVDVRFFEGLPFRTPQLHAAILRALKKGFPKTPVKL